MRLASVHPVLCAVAVLVCGCDRHEPLPRLYPAPSFQLTDQAGERFASSRLDGEVWIAGFIFTRCPSVCPMITSHMKNLQSRFAYRGVRLVSFSVDPENDTPAELTAYAERHHADLQSWSFLTGEPEEMRRVVVEGFHVAMGDREPAGDAYDILHTRSLLLVDRGGSVRGAYSTDPEGLARLRTDLVRVLDEDPADQDRP